MKNAFLVLVVTSALVGCAPPAIGPNDEIAAHSARWVEAFNDGDLETLAGFYSADASVMAPNMPPTSGHTGVEAVFSGMIQAGMGGELETVEILSVGDLGHHVGGYSLYVEDEMVDEGKFIEIWQRIDGEWKIRFDMFSSNLPLPGAGEEDEGDMGEAEEDMEEPEASESEDMDESE